MYNSRRKLTDNYSGNLSAQEKTDYINAVLCLQGKTALTPTSLVPGARSRVSPLLGLVLDRV
jgi:hypothetical protein